ncbi:MAG: DNRLRE domain-containing protein [Clostridia bacterium]|nr:DNRLRE domain-containing protein [Clostridia bacterium]
MNKQMFKIVAILMSFILFIHAFPSFPIPVSAESVTEETTEKIEAVPVMEVLEKRSEYAKHYRMSDGTYKMVAYPTPVHYQTDSEWAEIDQTLISSGNRLIPRSSPLEVSFGTTADDTLFSLKDRETDQELSFDLLNRQATPPETTLTANDSANAELIETQPDPYAVADRLKNKLTYQNVLAGTDIEYELTSNRIKESIIIESASSTQNYTFQISGADYRLVLESDNSVSIYRKADDSLAYVIEAPYMFDAAGAESTDIEVTIAEVKGTWLMNIAPSSTWLNHPARVYPVTLDPTVLVPYLGEFIKAASHKGTTVTHLSASSGMLDSGLTKSGSQLTSTYIKFSLPQLDMELIASSNSSVTNDRAFFAGTVVDAQLHFLVQNAGSTPSKLPIMEVFRNTSAWINNFTNSNRPTKAELPEAAAFVSQTITAGAYYQYTANITSMVRSWYKDPSTNHGLCLTPTLQQTNGSNFDFNVGFYANNSDGDEVMQTAVSVTYINNVGLENYWTYTSEAVGNGAIHVNHNSGLATAVVTDTVSNNQRNGASITHVYHDAMVIYNSPAGIGEVGKGFMLNVQELLWEQYDENNDLYYRHRDADGTIHYYLPTATANRYEKETDPTSYLIVPSSSSQPIKLYYKDKSFKEFLNNCLSACEDANGNRIEITLNTTTDSEFCYPNAVKEILANGVSRDTTLTWEEINNVPHLSSISSPDSNLSISQSTASRIFSFTSWSTAALLFATM